MKLFFKTMDGVHMCIICSNFEDLLEFIKVNELNMTNYSPITGSYVIGQ